MEGRLEGGLSKNVNCGVCSLYFANRDYDSIIVFKHVILLTGDILWFILLNNGSIFGGGYRKRTNFILCSVNSAEITYIVLESFDLMEVYR